MLGEFAKLPRYQGAGSSRINPTRLEDACSAFGEEGIAITYAGGYSLKKPDVLDEAVINAACEVARARTRW